MLQTKRQDVRALAVVVQDVAKNLSPHAVTTLVAHPDAVQSALAVAADALAAREAGANIEIVRGAKPRLVATREADQHIAAHTQPGKQEELLTSQELANRAGLKTRQSVHDWLKKGRIIGWQGAKRGFVFPAAQFDDRGQPLDGLDRIAAHFDNGYAAWVWLTTPRTALDGRTPLALLRKGELDQVAAAVAGDIQGDFA